MTERDLMVALLISAAALGVWLFAGFRKEFDVMFINVNTERIECAIVRFPGYGFNFKNLSIGADATIGGARGLMAEECGSGMGFQGKSKANIEA